MTPGPVDSTVTAIADPIAKVIAFYLPQFHPIPENDAWWGKGFTEWTNVRRAKPLFDGHDQPAVPTSLGYYDLRDIETHHAQAAIARAHGVAAFCYYAYWFGGRQLLEQPLALVGANPDLQMPYAICWANETWSRRWDGSENEILVPQRHSPEADPGFIDSIAGHLADPRYLRVDGRPLLILYRPGLLIDPLRTTDALRQRAVQLGLQEPYLAMVQTFGHWEPVSYGFDAAVEFPPHNLSIDPPAAIQRAAPTLGDGETPALWFEDAMRTCLSRRSPGFPWFRGVMPGWDNTPRRGPGGSVFVGATIDLFRGWLESVLEYTYLFNPPGRRLLFVNAWNEWAEGAYLEPDASRGTSRLEAVRDAIASTSTLARESAAPSRGGLLDIARARWTSR